MRSKRRGRRERRTKRHRRRLTYSSFAAALAERSGLRQASCALPAGDAEPVEKVKRRFGPLAVARFMGVVLKALGRLTRSRDGA